MELVEIRILSEPQPLFHFVDEVFDDPIPAVQVRLDNGVNVVWELAAYRDPLLASPELQEEVPTDLAGGYLGE